MYSWPLLCLPHLCSKLIGEARVPVRGQMAAAELWTGPRTAARAPPWHVLTIKINLLASWPRSFMAAVPSERCYFLSKRSRWR